MSEWQVSNTATLIAEGTIQIGDGYRAKNSEFVVDGGLPFVRVGDVGTSSVNTNELDELPLESQNKYEPKVSRPGDVLITMKGTVGRVAYVTDSMPSFVYSPQISFWRSNNESIIVPRWLRYWLEGPEFGWQASATKGATDMADYINLRDQRQMQITLPPLNIQRQISEVLGSIDDLIENNRRRVELLEQMARAIYREWFVHFRYPGHEDVPLVDSALGPIPQGWEVMNLFDAADVGFGYSFKSPQFGESGAHQVIRIRDIPNGISSTFTDEIADERYRVQDDDVLIGMDGDFHMTVWTGEDAWLNQRVTRLRPKLGLNALHLLLSIESQIIEWNRAIVGTTVAHLGKKHLELVTVLVPDAGLLKHSRQLFRSIMDKRRGLIQASRRLATLRDMLLPKLVTGQIDVSELDLEESVGNAVSGASGSRDAVAAPGGSPSKPETAFPTGFQGGEA